jgi:hypothetical protein
VSHPPVSAERGDMLLEMRRDAGEYLIKRRECHCLAGKSHLFVSAMLR